MQTLELNKPNTVCCRACGEMVTPEKTSRTEMRHQDRFAYGQFSLFVDD